MTQTKGPEGPKGKVYIIGGGPGDPELLTLKAKRIIESADVIVYADSLVHPAILDFASPEAQKNGSKTLTLEEITTLILESVREGKVVARIQSGDPAIYGAVIEQLRVFEGEGVATGGGIVGVVEGELAEETIGGPGIIALEKIGVLAGIAIEKDKITAILFDANVVGEIPTDALGGIGIGF